MKLHTAEKIGTPLGTSAMCDMRCILKYTHLLWDFNGTIFSDMEAGIVSVNQMLRERGIAEIADLTAYREVFDFPIKDYYAMLGFDFEKESYETVLAPMWVELYNIHSQKSGLSLYVKEILEKLNKMGIEQSVLSACEIKMLTETLKKLEIYDYFKHVWGLDNIHAASKLHLAEKWRAENPDAKVLYLGDTLHDAETAKVLGSDCILYAGGHQSRRRLEKAGCPVIGDLRELLDYL